MDRNYPDPGMQSLLQAARRYSESTASEPDTSVPSTSSRHNNRWAAHSTPGWDQSEQHDQCVTKV